MKALLAKGVSLILFTTMVAACSGEQQQKLQPEQSVLVTAANETAAMARLRAIAAAEARYMVESGGEYGSLDQLIQGQHISDPSRGKLTGYRFEIHVKPGGFQLTAVPERFGVTGTRSFYVDETNIIHAADKKGAPATASDPEA
jgi:hypothetical protein